MRLALIVGTIAVIAVAGCKDKGAAPPVRAGGSLADSAEQVMFNIHFLLTEKGVQRGELFADTAYIFDENTRFDLRKVRSTFNTATGTKDGVMSADRGKYNFRQQILEGYGHVVIVTNDGKRLTTSQIRYMQGINEVSSDSAFTLVQPGKTASGIGFKSDPQLTRLTILKGAKGTGSFVLPGTE